MIELPLAWWGVVVALLYATVGWYVRDLYPFSAYALYASATDRSSGAVPAFFVNGKAARLIDYIDFTGMDADKVSFVGFECAHHWMVHESRRWIDEHQADEPVGPDEGVEAVWGFQIFRIDEDGEIHERFEPVVTGRARVR